LNRCSYINPLGECILLSVSPDTFMRVYLVYCNQQIITISKRHSFKVSQWEN